MSISPPAVRHVALGAQRPRILAVPDFVSSTGEEAIELAAMAGLELDPWQQFVITNALGERADGSWAAFEVGIEVPRQNGKGGILEARELAGLFLLGERLLIHSAHEFATAIEAFERMKVLLESCPDLDRRVKRITNSHGFEGIELKGGQRLRYKTRTKGGGRGFSADWVGLDEAMDIPEAMQAALFPTLSARPNPQIWYAGSAVDQETMDNGLVFARLRERALKGGDARMAYFGWSPDIDSPDDVTPEMAADPEVWAQANPSLGIRITSEYIEGEQRSLGPRGFAVERLGVGDWPATDGSSNSKISEAAWDACEDPESSCSDPVVLVFDVTPDRSRAVIGVAGWRADGLAHVEVVDSRKGTGWVGGRLAELTASHNVLAIMYDERGPAASLVPGFADLSLDVDVTPINSREQAEACGMFFDAVEQRTTRHLGTADLLLAVRGAATRPLGDAWAWARKTSSANIAPLVTVTLAHWGLRTLTEPDGEPLVAFI